MYKKTHTFIISHEKSNDKTKSLLYIRLRLD